MRTWTSNDVVRRHVFGPDSHSVADVIFLHHFRWIGNTFVCLLIARLSELFSHPVNKVGWNGAVVTLLRCRSLMRLSSILESGGRYLTLISSSRGEARVSSFPSWKLTRLSEVCKWRVESEGQWAKHTNTKVNISVRKNSLKSELIIYYFAARRGTFWLVSFNVL